MSDALLIAGIDANGSSRLPRLFSDAGYQVTLLGSPSLTCAKSSFVSTLIPALRDPAGAAVAALKHLAQNADRYSIVVLADEPVLWAALDLGDAQSLQGWFPVPLDECSLERLRSKITFLIDCSCVGIRVPQFAVCQSLIEACRSADEIGYPLFAKATRGIAGSGVMYARSRQDLESQLPTFWHGDSIVLQQEVQGKPGSISVLFDRGRPVCWYSYMMLETWPNRFSAASSIQMFPHRDAEALVEAVGSLTQFHGLAGIDWVHDETNDRLVLLELNPRPTPVFHLGPHAGVDFSRGLREMREGRATSQRPNNSQQVIRLFPQALYHAVQQRHPLEFISAFNDAPWKEPRMMMSHLRKVITHHVPVSVKAALRPSHSTPPTPNSTS